MASKWTERRHERNRRAVEAWPHPVGTRVRVARDNGTTLETTTASEAMLVDGKHALILVHGIPGRISLGSVTLVRP